MNLEKQKVVFKTKEGRKCLVFYETFWKFFPHLKYLNLVLSVYLNWCVQGLSRRSFLKISNHLPWERSPGAHGSASAGELVLVRWRHKSRKQNLTFLVFPLRICWFYVTHNGLDSAEMRAGVGPWCAASVCLGAQCRVCRRERLYQTAAGHVTHPCWWY